jgi:hypothetical protein
MIPFIFSREISAFRIETHNRQLCKRFLFVISIQSDFQMKYLYACGIILLFFGASCKSSTTTGTKAKYQCPMKCEGDKTYDTAGKCPVCGMDMEKVK